MLAKIIIEGSERQFYVVLTLLSMFLLIDNVNSLVEDAGLVLLSLPMLRRPVTLIPMMFIASWNVMIGVFGLGAFYYYALLFFVAMLYSNRQYGQYVGLTRTNFYYLLFAIWIVVSSLHSDFGILGPALKQGITILIVIFVGLYKCRDKEYLFITLMYVAVFASIYFFWRILFAPAYFFPTNGSSYFTPEIRKTLMTQLNPNTAAQIVLCLSILLLAAIANIDRKIRVYILPLLLNLSTLIVIGSRSSFYALAITVIYYLFFIYEGSQPKKFFIVVFSSLVIISAIIYIQYIQSRLVVSSLIEDQGSGRFINWAVILKEVVPEHWHWGIGYGIENYRVLGYRFDADNLYIDLICQLGIMGLFIFFLMWIHLIRCVRFLKDSSVPVKFITIMLLCYPILGFGETLFNMTSFWAFLMLAIILINGDVNVAKDTEFSFVHILDSELIHDKETAETQVK